MTRSVHMTAGVATMLFLSVKAPGGFEFMNVNILPAVAMVTSAVGSFLPDFDTKPMHYSQGKKGVAKKVAKVKAKAVNSVTGGHRGITHTLLFPVIFAAVLYYIGMSLSSIPTFASLIGSLIFGLLAGWGLHIFADLFNGKGVPLFWPLLKSKIHLMDFPSEGIGQWIWCVLYLIVAFMLIIGKEIL